MIKVEARRSRGKQTAGRDRASTRFPAPHRYQRAANNGQIGLPPEQVIMVAAHPLDLKAAAAAGLRTAFVEPKLSEPDRPGLHTEPTPEAYDYYAQNFTDLADQLCQ